MPASRTNRLLIGAAAAVGVLAGAAGIASAVTDDGGDPTPSLARSEAEAAAVEEVPGTVVDAEADDEDGRAVWSVEVDGDDGRRHEVDVADDGTVVARDTDDDRSDDGERDDDLTVAEAEAAERDATVTREEAERAALAEAPGTVHRTEVEEEDGRTVWDVEVDGEDGARHDVQVDTASGDVVEHDVDDD